MRRGGTPVAVDRHSWFPGFINHICFINLTLVNTRLKHPYWAANEALGLYLAVQSSHVLLSIIWDVSKQNGSVFYFLSNKDMAICY